MALDLSGLKLPPGVTPDMLQVQQAPPPPLTVVIEQYPMSAFAIEENEDDFLLRMEVPISPNSKKDIRFPFSRAALRLLETAVTGALEK
jgi:hypothetical protein